MLHVVFNVVLFALSDTVLVARTNTNTCPVAMSSTLQWQAFPGAPSFDCFGVSYIQRQANALEHRGLLATPELESCFFGGGKFRPWGLTQSNLVYTV